MNQHASKCCGCSTAGFMLAIVLVTSAQAEDPTRLPMITVRPQPPIGGNSSGTDVGGGGGNTKGAAKTLERLNRELKRKVDAVNPTINAPPIDARSPDTRIGVVNIPAVQQQYGKNFGVSAVPFRPPPLIYSAPLGHR